MRTSFALVALGFVAVNMLACTKANSAGDSTAAETAGDADPAISCTIEYEYLDNAGFVTGPIASATGHIRDYALEVGVGSDAGQSPFFMFVARNPNPAYNLSIEADLYDRNAALVAYAVLPASALGAQPYLFEIGANIPKVNADGYDGQKHDFNAVRAYCSVLGEADGGPAEPDGGVLEYDGGSWSADGSVPAYDASWSSDAGVPTYDGGAAADAGSP